MKGRAYYGTFLRVWLVTMLLMFGVAVLSGCGTWRGMGYDLKRVTGQI